MSRAKVIALRRRREPEFNGDHLFTLLLVLVLLLLACARASAQAPANDNACNATVINLGVNSPFNNTNATSQLGDPAIPAGTCTAQGNWCSGEPAPQASHTVWFKFTVPPTGTGSYAFRVNGTAGTFDSQVALFSAANCADLTNGNAIRLGANDDSTGSLFNSYMTVFCLTPTVTYYIMVDGYATTTSASFYVHVIELSDRNAVANAGADQTICYSLFPTFPVNGTVQGVAGSTAWSSTGDGTFANAASLSTSYTPGLNDKSSGSVQLILSTNDPVGVCGASRDTLVLSIIPDSIYAGADKTICSAEQSIAMTAQAFLFTSYLWTTSGDGTFDDPASLTAIYTPGTNDRLQSFVNLVLRGVSTQCFNTVYDTLKLFNSASPGALVNLGNDTIVCSSGGTISLSALQLSGYSSVNWTGNGTGTFSNPNSVTTNYTFSIDDLNAGVVSISLSAQGVSPCQGIKVDTKQVFIQQPPVIHSITGGGSYCSNTTITVTADVEFYNDLHWSTSGSGSFTSPNDLVSDYNPSAADLSNGFVTLTLIADATSPCNVNTSNAVNVIITPAPVFSINVPSTSCAGNKITLNASVANFQTVNWSSAGDGSFDNPSSTKPAYTPGPLDIASGSVAFTFTVLGNSPCNAFFANGSTIISPNPSVNAGANQQVCTGNTVSVNASVANSSFILWDTDGDGFFFNPNTASTIYIPGPGDYITGSVNLFVAVDGVSPCNSSANDAVLITFIEHAIADAGPDDDIVAGQTVTLDGFAENASANFWTTSGNGTFNNNSLLNAVYTPGSSDIVNGAVTLTLHSTDVAPCNLSDTDQMVVNIFPDGLLAVKIYIEGMYTYPGNVASLFLNNMSADSLRADSVTFSFHDTIPPYASNGNFNTVVGTNGIAIISVPAAYAGHSYYIAVNHRNSIETWTKNPVNISSFGLIDFTASPVMRALGHDKTVKADTSSRY
ncbi:MAG: hypothetical protein ABI772_08810 [Bacteroidota bacterium]